MQADNYNYKPDEQFTNRGWDEMKKKLDKEMPVEKKRRKGIIWFYFLGALLLAGAVLVFNFYKSPNISVEEEQRIYAKEDNPVINQNQNQNQKLNQNLNDENTLTIKEGLTTENEVNILTSQVGSESFTKTKKFNNSNSRKASNNLVNHNSTGLNNNNIVAEPLLENAELESVNLANNSTEVIENKIDSASISLSAISFLDFLLEEKERQIAMIDDADLESNKSNLKIIKHEKKSEKRAIEFGLNAGALMDMENKRKIGGFASTQIHFPLGKKLGIRTGLGYSLINKNLNYRYSDVQSALIDNSALNLPPINYIEINTYTLFELVRFHYLEAPLLMTYSPSEKWQFHVGANVSYLLKDELKSVNSGFNFVDIDDASTQGVELASLSNESIDLNQFQQQDYWNKWNMNAVLGVSYNMNAHWKIELQYHRSFARFLDTNEEGIFQDVRANLSANQTIDPSISTGFSGVYNIQNIANEADQLVSDSSSPSKLNINHSLRLGIGFKF